MGAARDYSTLGSNRLFNRFLHFPYLAVLSDTLFPLAHFNLIPNSMEEIFDKLKVGLNVDIQRTDGRIHSAVVSGVNATTRSVTVEWFERGETKGKEIELDQILDLNQDLAPQSYENSNVIPNKLQKVMLNTGCPGSQ